MTDFVVRPAGRVESPLLDRAQAPEQGDEGAPDAWPRFTAAVGRPCATSPPGTDVFLLTWLDRADHADHPRGDTGRPATGVFSTRSPDRPNPVGPHRVTILAVDGTRVRVRGPEALDGTPIVDVKPVLGRVEER
ncbi:TrmO family methyltransferase [Dactylosporangium sp. NPDC005555]|uniref:TrmO family methyltransferase domain-containing protein n=1 Tax=Dactylosporangium sp. NPDC005555 TaxID=3154889 RepID=UPI0033B6967A